MGVTLERVQFKFASIIGELCSEPDILSQFAVWVDLRLAEYKLKGSISLDCSGDTPDPVWLKGILSALLAKRLSKRREQSNPASHSFGDSPLGNGSYSYMSSPMSRTQREMSRDDTRVNIKEEPCEDGVFPVKFHKNQTAAAHRKRSATETVTSEEDSVKDDVLYSHSTSKHRRTESTAQASNESLMSIIGVEEQQDNASEMYDNIKDTIDLIVDSEEMGNAGQEATNVSSSTVYHSDDRAASTSLDRLQDNSFTSPNTGNCSVEGVFPTLFWSTRSRRHEDRQTDTLKKTTGHVKLFHAWLSRSEYADNRRLEEFPPDELDNILETFFTTLKRPDGGEYSHNSLRSLRDSLERHLRQFDYPGSLTTHSSFPKSQLAYKLKIRTLKK